METRVSANVTTLWVATRSRRPESALEEGNLIASCHYGPFPQGDAEQYAKDETAATGKETYVFQVEMVLSKGYKIYQEVHAFDPTK